MTTNKRMVELDAVQKVLLGLGVYDENVKSQIEALQSIPNPIEIAEEIKDELVGLQPPEWALAKIDILNELLSKLKS